MGRADASNPVRVLVVEDQPAIRQAIASEFERDPDFELVGKAGSLAEARGMLKGADVAILDLDLPDGFGGDLIPELRAANPAAHAVVLTSTFNPAERMGAIQSGAAAVLDKMTHLGDVAQAIRRLLAGEPLVSSEEYLR
jgi:DNA-binding NarL/FixJ family response regulator